MGLFIWSLVGYAFGIAVLVFIVLLTYLGIRAILKAAKENGVI